MRTSLKRYEGRLFIDNQRLCLVIKVDDDTGLGLVSFRADGQQQLVEMPLADIGLRITSTRQPMLDNVNSQRSHKRVTSKKEGWYFTSREGEQGPYKSEEEAKQELGQYIVASQSPEALETAAARA